MKSIMFGATVLSTVVLAGCGDQGTDSNDPVEKARAKLAEIERNIDARTPRNQSTVALIEEAGRWYKEPRFIWVGCERCAEQLTRDGLATDPRDILRGSIEVMERLGIQPGT